MAWGGRIAAALTFLFGLWALWPFAEGRGGLAALPRAIYTIFGMIAFEGLADEFPTLTDPLTFESLPYIGTIISAIATVGFGLAYLFSLFVRRNYEQVKLHRFTRGAHHGTLSLAVVCGLGRVGSQLVRDLTDEKRRARRGVIAIEIDPDNPAIETARERGAVVLVGNASDKKRREKARLDLADELFIACGDDATNLDVAALVATDVEDDAGGPTRPLLCIASVSSPTLAKAARDNPIFSDAGDGFRLRVFNLPDNAARALMVEELGRAHAPSLTEVAYYIVVGFGTVGQAVALNAAKLAHFENGRRLRMTVVDDWKDAATERARSAFLERYPAFAPDPMTFDLGPYVHAPDPAKDEWTARAGRPFHPAWRRESPIGRDGRPIAAEYVVNAEFVDLPASFDSPEFADLLTERLTPGQSPEARPVLIVAFDEDRRNLEAALSLGAALARRGSLLPLFVYLGDEEGLAVFLERGRRAGTLDEVKAFGSAADCGSYERLVQAEVFHLADTFHIAHGRAGREEGAVDPARSAWLEHAFKGSSEAAAHHVAIKLDAAKRLGADAGPTALPPEARDALARMEHNRYVAERLLEGWRYGPRSDTEKLRESLCAWEHLPESEQKKDHEQVELIEARWRQSSSGGTIR